MLPGLAWQACLKKTNIEFELLTDYDMLRMVEEGIRGGICHSIHRYANVKMKEKIDEINGLNNELNKENQEIKKELDKYK